MRAYSHDYQEFMQFTASAPGRINLIGEHTDYNGGLCLPMALDLGITLTATVAAGHSTLFSPSFGSAECSLAKCTPGESSGWTAYVQGVAWVMRQMGIPVPEISARITSDLPVGIGLSSSAALQVATARLLCQMTKCDLTAEQIVEIAYRSENEFVGVRCGRLDMMASALGVRGEALLIDFADLTTKRVALPDELSVVVCDTETPRHLAESGYNQRRAECEQACNVLGIASLREANLNQIKHLPPPLDRRVRHVITENERCLQMVEAFNIRDLPAIGRLMSQSHHSLRFDYEVSSPELDRMVDAADSCTELGCRLVGAGFGGACIALVQRGREEEFIQAVHARYGGGKFLSAFAGSRGTI